MREIADIIDKYLDIDFSESLSTTIKIKQFSNVFYMDVANIYDAITRLKNKEKYKSGYGSNDAAILGLLVRTWKILKEAVFYYERNNDQMLSMLDRSMIESSITAIYLMKSSSGTIEDYRKCAYKDRVRALQESTEKHFFQTNAGIRLVNNIKLKMDHDGFDLSSFSKQVTQKWKLDGKNFYEIFSTIENPDFYKYLYGFGSESIHGSWCESLDHDLIRNDDGTYDACPFFNQTDIRFLTPIIRVTNQAYNMWIDRIEATNEYDGYFVKVLKLVDNTNAKIFEAFDKIYSNN